MGRRPHASGSARPGTGQVMRRFLWVAYDHLGSLVLLNLLWALLSLPWLLGGYLLVRTAALAGGVWVVAAVPLAAEAVILSPPTVLLFVAGMRWAAGRDVDLRELLVAARQHAWRAQALGAAAVLVSVLALMNAAVYGYLAGWFGWALSGLMLWFQAGVCMTVIYVYPVLITQQTGVWATVRQSVLLVADNLRLTLGLAVACLAFLGVGVVSGAGLFCGLLAAPVLLISVCFRCLVARYTGEALDEEPPRSWRDLIRPWET